jgi:hypothetical protein
MYAASAMLSSGEMFVKCAFETCATKSTLLVHKFKVINVYFIES